MDKVSLHGIDVFARHGVLPAERELGQGFVIDADLWCDCAPAARLDDLDQALDYTRVHSLVIQESTRTSFQLIEALAGHLCAVLLRDLPIDKVAVTVQKTNPPIPDFRGTASVTLERGQGWQGPRDAEDNLS
jgi:dihydroneopterin aldolase